MPKLFDPVLVPEAVARELDTGRQLRVDTINPRSLSWVEVVEAPGNALRQLPANNLGPGERAVIAGARSHPNCVAGLDDRAARSFAKSLGLQPVGIVGILLRAKRAGLVSEVAPLLDALQSEGFRLGADLRCEALRLAAETG